MLNRLNRQNNRLKFNRFHECKKNIALVNKDASPG